MASRRLAAVGARRRRRWRGLLVSLSLVGLAILGGLLLDPGIVGPIGPLATRPEHVDADFSRCGKGARQPACVVDGDTFRIGDRRLRILGIDAPELKDSRCPAEHALAERSADRLAALLSDGPFLMVGHRLQTTDKYGRELVDVRRGDQPVGDQLIADGLAHRYRGMKTGWCD